jgi:hypothetical protein
LRLLVLLLFLMLRLRVWDLLLLRLWRRGFWLYLWSFLLWERCGHGCSSLLLCIDRVTLLRVRVLLRMLLWWPIVGVLWCLLRWHAMVRCLHRWALHMRRQTMRRHAGLLRVIHWRVGHICEAVSMLLGNQVRALPSWGIARRGARIMLWGVLSLWVRVECAIWNRR